MDSFSNVSVTAMIDVGRQASIVSSETRYLLEIIFHAGITTSVCLVGILANLMNCLVFCNQGLQDRTSLCLFSFSFVDAAYLVGTLVGNPLSFFLEWTSASLFEKFYTHVYIVIVGVSYGLRATSFLITMVIAVERCVCVLFPFRASKLITTRFMGTCLIIFFLFPQICYVTMPLSYYGGIVIKYGTKTRVFYNTRFYINNETFIKIFLNTVLGFAIPVAVFSIVSIATCLTVIKLKTALRWREESTGGGESSIPQKKLTVMLMVAASVYIATTLPFVAREMCLLVWSSDINTPRYFDLFLTVSVVVRLLPQINSSIHCVIYYRRSSRFRLHFHNIINRVTRKLCVSGQKKVATVIK